MLTKPDGKSPVERAVADIRTFLKEKCSNREFDLHLKRLQTGDITVVFSVRDELSHYFLTADRLARAHTELRGWSDVVQRLNDWIDLHVDEHLSR